MCFVKYCVVFVSQGCLASVRTEENLRILKARVREVATGLLLQIGNDSEKKLNDLFHSKHVSKCSLLTTNIFEDVGDMVKFHSALEIHRSGAGSQGRSRHSEG